MFGKMLVLFKDAEFGWMCVVMLCFYIISFSVCFTDVSSNDSSTMAIRLNKDILLALGRHATVYRPGFIKIGYSTLINYVGHNGGGGI